MDLIKSAGYPAETHHVTTDDGYILEVHRSHVLEEKLLFFQISILGYLDKEVPQSYTSMATSLPPQRLSLPIRALAS